MCLNRILKKHEKNNKIEFGWKVFNTDTTNKDELISWLGDYKYEKNKEYTAKNLLLLEYSQEKQYYSGFHYCLRKKDAKFFISNRYDKIFKVKIEDIRYEGETDILDKTIRVNVGQKMTIL